MVNYRRKRNPPPCAHDIKEVCHCGEKFAIALECRYDRHRVDECSHYRAGVEGGKREPDVCAHYEDGVCANMDIHTTRVCCIFKLQHMPTCYGYLPETVKKVGRHDN